MLSKECLLSVSKCLGGEYFSRKLRATCTTAARAIPKCSPHISTWNDLVLHAAATGSVALANYVYNHGAIDVNPVLFAVTVAKYKQLQMIEVASKIFEKFYVCSCIPRYDDGSSVDRVAPKPCLFFHDTFIRALVRTRDPIFFQKAMLIEFPEGLPQQTSIDTCVFAAEYGCSEIFELALQSVDKNNALDWNYLKLYCTAHAVLESKWNMYDYLESIGIIDLGEAFICGINRKNYKFCLGLISKHADLVEKLHAKRFNAYHFDYDNSELHNFFNFYGFLN